jgi:hypothetical protein
MSDPHAGAIVFVYPLGTDEPDKAYPAIVMDVHPAAKAKGDKPGHSATLDLLIVGWHAAPVLEAPGIPYLAKWDDAAPRPFALAAPHKKAEPVAKAA